MRPGQVTASAANRSRGTRFSAHEPYARHVDDDPPGLAEATILRDAHGWTDVDIGALLGITTPTCPAAESTGSAPSRS